MNIIADTHTHTIANDHAYSTLRENVEEAAKKGLRFLAMTEHGPGMPGGPSHIHFANLHILPRVMQGVVILKGAEVNILDKEGSLDIEDRFLDRLDWVIASLHIPTIRPTTREDHTEAWLRIAENPLIDVIGHCGDGRYPFDEAVVIPAFKKHGKIIEINSHSFSARPGSSENCPRIAKLCACEGIPVVVSSDSHYYEQIGHVDEAVAMLAEIDFPQELILNADFDRFKNALLGVVPEETRRFLQSLE